jgi:hypothetical protein
MLGTYNDNTIDIFGDDMSLNDHVRKLGSKSVASSYPQDVAN